MCPSFEAVHTARLLRQCSYNKAIRYLHARFLISNCVHVGVRWVSVCCGGWPCSSPVWARWDLTFWMWWLVYGLSFHQLYTPLLSCYIYLFVFFSRKLWIWNPKWLVLQPVYSAAQSSQNIKDTAPGYRGLFLYSTHVFPEQTSLNSFLDSLIWMEVGNPSLTI